MADFDPESGRLSAFSRSSADGILSGQPVRGHFARLGPTLAVLYRHQEDLWLRLGDVSVDLTHGATDVRWQRTARQATLSLVEGGRQLIAVEYEIGPDIENDPTPFAESEHWDFGLFVRNVVTNPERSDGIYRG